MSLLSRILGLVFWIGAVFAAPVLHAQGQGNCYGPHDFAQVPTPGFLRDEVPNPYFRVDQTLLPNPVSMISYNNSTITFQMPGSGLPSDTQIKIVHIEPNGQEKVIANLRTCDNWGGGGSGGDDTRTPSTGIRPMPGTDSILGGRPAGPVPPATRNEVAAPSGGAEFLMIGGGGEMARAQVMLLNAGVTILSSQALTSLEVRATTIDLNGAMTIEELRALLARENIAVTVDRHTVYGSAGGGDEFAAEMVNAGGAEGCHISRPIRIGMIDGPIDTSHTAFEGASISSVSVLQDNQRAGSTDHATGLASLILARPSDSQPGGMAQGAQLFNAVAFARSGGREVAPLLNVALGLDWLLSRQVDIINLSLAGPYNDTMAELIRRTAAQDVILVAATGNGGQDAVSYPASDDSVIAVTAVDQHHRVYRRANTGPEVTFAAPGVDVAVASRRGLSYRSGTSYATAIVTALISHEIANGFQGRTQILNALIQNTLDLGDSGHDDVFGWGLIQTNFCD